MWARQLLPASCQVFRSKLLAGDDIFATLRIAEATAPLVLCLKKTTGKNRGYEAPNTDKI
jgi:hypothetical protein